MRPLMICLVLLAGCAQTFTRPDTPLPQYQVDLAECRQRQAGVPAGPQAGGLAGVLFMADYASRQRQVLADCMTTKGYQKE